MRILKKLCLLCAMAALITGITGCGRTRFNEMSYVRGEIGTYTLGDHTTDVVYVYTEYRNVSGVPSVPADFLEVRAFQDDTELEPLFFTQQRINDCMQSNQIVRDSTKIPVVWIFGRVNDSPVMIEMDTGSGTERYSLE